MMAEITKAEPNRQGSRWRLFDRWIITVEDIRKDYHKDSGH